MALKKKRSTLRKGRKGGSKRAVRKGKRLRASYGKQAYGRRKKPRTKKLVRRGIRRQGRARRRRNPSSPRITVPAGVDENQLYQEGYNETYQEGFNSGFAKGFEDGHKLAYQQQE